MKDNMLKVTRLGSRYSRYSDPDVCDSLSSPRPIVFITLQGKEGWYMGSRWVPQ